MTAAQPEPSIETHGPPAFEPNEKVRAVIAVRSDGAFPGVPRGAPLIEAGAVGYVRSIGEFLQRYYIYAVDFIDGGRLVGMRAHELESLDRSHRAD